MVNYQLGKIYKITGNNKTYVGSTCCPLLSQRLAKHRDNYKQYLNGKNHYITSFECISDPNCTIELLELCSCSCYDELAKVEAKWIKELDCVNKVFPTRTKAEWYDANKDKILEQQREYRETNKEKINAKKRERYRQRKEQKNQINIYQITEID